MSNYNLGKKIVISESAVGTRALAKKIAGKLIKQYLRERAFVLSLRGDLGSGKTTFVQGLAEGLGVAERIISPTFVLMKKFKVYGLRFKFFYHIDCYRLQKPEEILDLGWREIMAEPKNIVVIEWPERIKKFLPKETIRIDFRFVDKNQREIKLAKERFLW